MRRFSGTKKNKSSRKLPPTLSTSQEKTTQVTASGARRTRPERKALRRVEKRDGGDSEADIAEKVQP